MNNENYNERQAEIGREMFHGLIMGVIGLVLFGWLYFKAHDFLFSDWTKSGKSENPICSETNSAFRCSK